MGKLGRIFSLIAVMVMITGTLFGCGSSNNAQTTSKSSGGGASSPSASPSTSPAAEKSGDSGKKIELRFSWWGSQDRHDRTLKVIKLFEQQNPNITIKPEFGGWNGYWDKRATQAAGGDLPDIIQMDKKYLQEYSGKNLLLDFNPYVKSGALNMSDVDKAYISGGYVDGKLYAVNIGANALAEIVDPQMYKQAGLDVPQPGYTWDDFVQQAKTLKAKLGKGVSVQGMLDKDYLEYYLRGRGQPFYNKDGTALGFDKQYLVDFLTMWDQLYKDKVLTPAADMVSVRNQLENLPIVHKKAPNQPLWSNQIVALEKAAGRPLAMTMIPIVKDEGDNKSYYIKPGQFLSVYANSKQKDAAVKFVDFFTNSLEANDILAAERGIPISQKVRDHLYPTLSDSGKKMFDFINTAMKYSGDVPPSPPGEGPVADAFQRAMDALGYGKLAPDKAADQFINEANQILAKNKK